MKATRTGDNRDFRATLSPVKGNSLPKRANGRVEIVVNGTPFVAPVTNNKAWSGSTGKWLEYIWLIGPDGKAYYLTLDPAEAAESWKGSEVTIAEGTAKRADPKRVTEGAAQAREAARVEKFKAWAASAE